MRTRRILKVVLGALLTGIAGIGGLLAWELLGESKQVVDQTFSRESTDAPDADSNPWEGRGREAIDRVKTSTVRDLTDSLGGRLRDDSPTVSDLFDDRVFVRETLGMRGLERRGWTAQWWGETEHGPHFYEVRYDFGPRAVPLGPVWLVDLEDDGSVVPKNLHARVVSAPREGVASTYYGRTEEVLEAIGRHEFESNLDLAGALLLYFERRSRDERDDSVRGWTIQPGREGRFRAYFGWEESDERRHAAFAYDFDRRALKADNLQAANIMEFGESYESVEPVEISPRQYHPGRPEGVERWSGAAGEAYRDPDQRDRIEALEVVLEQRRMVEALGWLLTVRADSASAFEECQASRRCKWKPERRDGAHRVTYLYDVGDGEKSIAWRVDVPERTVEPLDRLGRLAARATQLRRAGDESDS